MELVGFKEKRLTFSVASASFFMCSSWLGLSASSIGGRNGDSLLSPQLFFSTQNLFTP
jgi:hypothetical protein